MKEYIKYIIIGTVSLLVVVFILVFMTNKKSKDPSTETQSTETQSTKTGIVIRQNDSTVPCIGNDCFYLLE